MEEGGRIEVKADVCWEESAALLPVRQLALRSVFSLFSLFRPRRTIPENWACSPSGTLSSYPPVLDQAPSLRWEVSRQKQKAGQHCLPTRAQRRLRGADRHGLPWRTAPRTEPLLLFHRQKTLQQLWGRGPRFLTMTQHLVIGLISWYSPCPSPSYPIQHLSPFKDLCWI